MLSDMGEALDWVRQLAVDNGWKSMKIKIGPGVYIMISTHPDAAQTILRSGALCTYVPGKHVLINCMKYYNVHV